MKLQPKFPKTNAQKSSTQITIDPRESIERAFAQWSQPIFTHIIAKPYIGQPVQTDTALNHTLRAIAALLGGLSLSALSLTTGHAALPMLPIGWGLTTYGLHKFNVNLRHACAHNVLSGNRKLDTFLGNVFSIVTISIDYKTYRDRHFKVHHAAGLLKPNDGLYGFLIHTVGLRPHMSIQTLWRKCIIHLLSPKVHVRRCLQRLKNCFLSSDHRYRWAAILFWTPILATVHLTHIWWIFAIAWGIPTTVLFNTFTALRLLVEHRWPHPDYNNQRHRPALATMTAAIFFADATPQLSDDTSTISKLYHWSMWWTRFLLYHLPARALVLPGDAANHDFHHCHPASPHWTHAHFARQQDLENGCPGWPSPYTESWGLHNAIHDVLVSLTQQSDDILHED